MTRLDLSSLSSYRDSAGRLAAEILAPFSDAAQVAAQSESINAYPNLAALERPRSVEILDGQEGGPDGLAALGRRAVLEGEVYWEIAAAGEATRLQMGPKFFVTPDMLLARLRQEGGPAAAAAGQHPPLPLSLGRRRLLQLVLEIQRLALEAGEDPQQALKRQRILIIAAEGSIEGVVKTVLGGLGGLIPPESIRFMAQAAFHGFAKRDGAWGWAPESPRLPHNHGAMAMQKTMDSQLFGADLSGRRRYLSREEAFRELGERRDLVSGNIEDLDCLTRALDFESLGMAAAARGRGFQMLMEITPNNPERPIKGGCCAWDGVLGRDVMVESFRLQGKRPEDIHFLNRNLNHYMDPADVFRKVAEEGLFMPVCVRENYVYFQPVQGDINFLVPTAFFARRKTKALNSLKSGADIPAALEAFAAQDRQPDFQRLAADAF